MDVGDVVLLLGHAGAHVVVRRHQHDLHVPADGFADDLGERSELVADLLRRRLIRDALGHREDEVVTLGERGRDRDCGQQQSCCDST
jgi:hypothetical protein